MLIRHTTVQFFGFLVLIFFFCIHIPCVFFFFFFSEHYKPLTHISRTYKFIAARLDMDECFSGLGF